jgi:hypothetical protein
MRDQSFIWKQPPTLSQTRWRLMRKQNGLPVSDDTSYQRACCPCFPKRCGIYPDSTFRPDRPKPKTVRQVSQMVWLFDRAEDEDQSNQWNCKMRYGLCHYVQKSR